MSAALNRLAKWRTIFTGWQLGTRSSTDPEAQAVRDHRELTILMRAELNALVQMLVAKQVFTVQEFTDQLDIEAEHLSKQYEHKFPGCRATDIGIDIDVAKFAETSAHWRP